MCKYVWIESFLHLYFILFLWSSDKSQKNRKNVPKYNYIHYTVQTAKDRWKKFHFCCFPFDTTSLKIRGVRNLTTSLVLSVAKGISKPPFWGFPKSSEHQSLPCLFDSRFLQMFRTPPIFGMSRDYNRNV